MIVQREFP